MNVSVFLFYYLNIWFYTIFYIILKLSKYIPNALYIIKLYIWIIQINHVCQKNKKNREVESKKKIIIPFLVVLTRMETCYNYMV